MNDETELTQDQIKTLNELMAAWNMARAAEKQFQEDRLSCEEQILEIVGTQTCGSQKLGSMTISYGIDRKWDQAKLTELSQTVKAEYWPFRIEWKEDKKASDIIAERFPALWDEIQTALTTKPKKPSFSIKE